MKPTTISRTACLLFAFLLTRAHGQNCFSELSFEKLIKKLQDVKNCSETLSETWTEYQNAQFLNELHVLTDIIQKQQNKELLRLLPANCSAPAVPKDGGLLCAYVKNKVYCKPMCNAGNDFSFIRRSRLFEECSSNTQHKWTTQFIGGNTLATCIKSHIAVSGAPSAYFPEGHDCHKTKSDKQRMKNIMKIFRSELGMAGITQSINSSSLLCGKNIN